MTGVADEATQVASKTTWLAPETKGMAVETSVATEVIEVMGLNPDWQQTLIWTECLSINLLTWRSLRVN